MINGKIADSSVWIDYFNNLRNDKTEAIIEAVETDTIIILPVIVQEVLQGIRNQKDFYKTKKAYLQLTFLEYDPIEMAIQAASLYRFLITRGITIRKPNDCLIGVICIEHNYLLIHNDKDFTQIGKHTNLKIYNTNT